MLEYERELFDEFKRLESLCRDMFSCQHGVSEYISQMERVPAYIRDQIPFWNEDYRTLKHLRWLRNQIAHETTSTDCSLRDIEQLKDFYSRILNVQDPLAVSRRVKQKLQGSSCRRSAPAQKNVSQLNDKQAPKTTYKFIYGRFIVFALAVLIIIFILYFLHNHIP